MDGTMVNMPCDLGDRGYLAELHMIPRGKEFPLHWHDYYELEVILSGEGLHRHNDSQYTVSAGSAYLMSYYDFHSLQAVTDMMVLNVSFHESLLPQQLAEIISRGTNRLTCRFGQARRDYIRCLVDRLTEPAEDDPLRAHADRAILTLLLTEVIRAAEITPCRHDNTLVQNALAYLYKHFKQDISLEGIAGELSVSPTYLGTVFKRELGTAFNPYLNSVRLRYACNLLLSTRMSVKEIAYASGYNSVEYFLYVFRQKLGLTPSAYRAQNSGLPR
ncbi:MAG: helix-turn-helix domain-containing protein [Clostridia bacterium]|nr:helix-turn-helix domain-containing protein [Clostridia bacterium]